MTWQLQTALQQYWACSKDNSSIASALFDTEAKFGAPTVFARRARLQSELYRLATDSSRPGIPARILSGVIISTINPDTGVLSTTTGETFSADLIVGADGLNSLVRRIVAPDAHVLPTGLIAYITSVPAAAIKADPAVAFQTAPGACGMAVWEEGSRRLCCYPCDHGEDQYFQVVAYAPEGNWSEEFEKTGGGIIQGVPFERMVEDFSDFHPSVLAMVRYVEASGLYNPRKPNGRHMPTVSVWRIRDIEALHSWSKGKTVLIGDAAHAATPHVGQGCSMATEDAEALGFLFQDANVPADTLVGEFVDDAVASRIELFERLRIPRAHHVQLSARQVGRLLRGTQKRYEGEFDRVAFAHTMYGYRGAQVAYESQLAEELGET
ncbi:hypothetical protein HWV62_17820 [Athelia sp. TMB]|nr:hypothetical protein HWV62_17820 [Athelia sp. TMB]